MDGLLERINYSRASLSNVVVPSTSFLVEHGDALYIFCLLKCWFYSLRGNVMAKCWGCYKSSTRSDRIRLDRGNGLCSSCTRQLSCKRCKACVQGCDSLMIVFIHTWSLFLISYCFVLRVLLSWLE